MRIAQGNRVIVKKVGAIVINAAGTVRRVKTDGQSAWVTLDARAVDGAHPFPKDDPCAFDVLADASDCEPEAGKNAKGTRKQRRKAAVLKKDSKLVITVDKFGKDHWSTFGYLAHCAIDGIGGRLDIRKMRCDPNRHPLLAHEGASYGGPYPTRLKGGDVLHDHDDWDCADDLAAIGLLENVGTSMNPLIKLTALGHEVWKQLGAYKQEGGNFTTFTPALGADAAS
jgi:hypothetical protein